jgi:hypothetical protein
MGPSSSPLAGACHPGRCHSWRRPALDRSACPGCPDAPRRLDWRRTA